MTGARCAGCGVHRVPRRTVLCPLCNAKVATQTPFGWAEPTFETATALTMRVPAYIGEVPWSRS